MSGADLANLLNEASGSKFSGITGSGTRTVGLPDYQMVIEIVKILMNLYSVMLQFFVFGCTNHRETSFVNAKILISSNTEITTRWWFQRFLFSSLFREVIQIDEHIFQMGGNHQLDK